jgi:hypothetical protein
VPDKHFQQTRIRAKVQDHAAMLLLDSGAEISIIDLTFARKIGARIETRRTLECVGVGGTSYQVEGQARVKITLGQELVYEFTLWVGDLQDPTTHAILGMDFMVPAGVRLDTAYGAAVLPDEVRIQFEGRRSMFSDRESNVHLEEPIRLEPGEHHDVIVGNCGSSEAWAGSPL